MLKQNISSEIVQKIKKLEIFTRRLLNGSLVGDSRSAIKGTGFEFDQIRDYTFGDDIRFIDWKASARTNKLLIKQYREERSRTIFLVVDVSHSSLFGSTEKNKYDRIAEIASVLALAAQHGKDRVGLILFSDTIEAYIPPGNSLSHVHHIMTRLFSHPTKQSYYAKASSFAKATEDRSKDGSKTDISVALKHLLRLKKRDAIVFLISDFIDDTLGAYCAQAAHYYDMIAVRCLDDNEKNMPAVGFITVQDLETGELVELDARHYRGNETKQFLSARIEEQDKLLKKYGIDLFQIYPQKSDYLTDMIRFFIKRMMY